MDGERNDEVLSQVTDAHPVFQFTVKLSPFPGRVRVARRLRATMLREAIFGLQPASKEDFHLLRPTLSGGFDAFTGWVRFENENDPAGVFSRDDLLKPCDFTAEERRLGMLIMKENLSASEGVGFGL
jgi:hypothetical protein